MSQMIPVLEAYLFLMASITSLMLARAGSLIVVGGLQVFDLALRPIFPGVEHWQVGWHCSLLCQKNEVGQTRL